MMTMLRISRTKTSWFLQLTSSVATPVGLEFPTKSSASAERKMQQKRLPLMIRCKKLTVSKLKFKLQSLQQRRRVSVTAQRSQTIKMWGPATELASQVWVSLRRIRAKVYATSWESMWTRSPAKLLSRIKLPGKSKDARRAREQRFLIRSSACSESRTVSSFT